MKRVSHCCHASIQRIIENYDSPSEDRLICNNCNRSCCAVDDPKEITEKLERFVIARLMLAEEYIRRNSLLDSADERKELGEWYRREINKLSYDDKDWAEERNKKISKYLNSK